MCVMSRFFAGAILHHSDMSTVIDKTQSINYVVHPSSLLLHPCIIISLGMLVLGRLTARCHSQLAWLD